MSLIYRIRILKVVLLSILLLPAFAQEERLNFFHLTTEHGLTSNDVNGIVQDSTGYIWISTSKGLNRYDGYTFKHYKHQVNDSLSITDNVVSCLFVDSEGTIWVGFGNYGFCKYLPEIDGFKRYHSTDDTVKIMGNSVFAISEDTRGNLWIATNEGLNRFNKTSEAFKYYPSAKLLGADLPLVRGSDEITDLFIDEHTGVIYLAFHRSVVGMFHPESEKMDKIVMKDNPRLSSVLAQKNKIYIGSLNRGVKIYHLESGRMESNIFEGFGYTVKNIVAGPEENLWICTIDGVVKYNPVNKSYYRYTNIEGDLLSMTGTASSNLMFGNNNLIWVAVDQDGINYAVRNKPFNHVLINTDDFYSLSFTEITSINFSREGLQWVGYKAGPVEKFDLVNKKSKIYQIKNKEGKYSGTVFKIHTDREGATWMGSWAGGLQKYNPKTDQFEIFAIDGNIPEPIERRMDVRSICEDDSGQLWMTVHGEGLLKLNETRDEFRLYRNISDDVTSLSNDWTYDVEWDDNFIWIATVWGLNRFDKSAEKVTRYYYHPDDSTTISSNRVNIIFKDERDGIWIGTHEGLNFYDKQRDCFIRINELVPIVNDEIKSMQNDQKGNLWVAVSTGLVKLTLKYNNGRTPSIENATYYNRNDGLQSYEFSGAAAAMDQDGNLFFGGNKGIDYFNPEKIKDQKEIPPLVITSVKIFNKDFFDSHSASYNDQVFFRHYQNMLTFEFAALSYLDPQNNKYSYRLQGLEEEWHPATTNRIANYSNLKPGNYTFMVRGSNSDGVWNNHGISWSFTIRPPWYGTLFFRIFMILIFISGGWGFFVYRTMRMRKKQQLLEKSVRQRTYELHEKTAALEEQAFSLNKANVLLENKQQQIEKQADELKTKSKNLTEINKQLSFTNSMKDKILSIIAHDLKNPFNTILGFSELLQSGYHNYDDEKRLRMLEYVYSSSKSAYNLLDNLLQWSRSQTNRLKINPDRLDLNDLIGENYNLLKDSFHKKKITFNNQVKSTCLAYADPNLVSTIIRNLLSNAIKFSFEGMSIEVSCESVKGNVVLHVKDEGIGINEKDISGLFDLESSLSREGTEGEAGTGFGLLLCKEFVEKSGGEIWVESAPGHGSTFSFSLPKASISSV